MTKNFQPGDLCIIRPTSRLDEPALRTDIGTFIKSTEIFIFKEYQKQESFENFRCVTLIDVKSKLLVKNIYDRYVKKI